MKNFRIKKIKDGLFGLESDKGGWLCVSSSYCELCKISYKLKEIKDDKNHKG